mmetsp:Transcript_105370/g.304806  ORF Transcript_105370/g.304806 Transcript_105370/m.304806 type:complete len:276 (-) Transcript_105370:1619-2446(-)
MFTRQFAPKRYWRPGCPRYVAISDDLWRPASILVHATMDIPAVFLISLSPHSGSNRQMTMNVSPEFLFGDPEYKFATPCTISAIWFTKVMILDWSTSVATLKSRMRTTPTMQSTRVPGIMALTPALSPPCMLWPMMFAPASPKPSANSEPNLMIVFSKMTVSIGSLTLLKFSEALWQNFRNGPMASNFSRNFAASISSRRYSISPSFMASKGLSLMVSIFAIILSIGFKSSLFALLEKDIAPMPTAKHMNIVCKMLSQAPSCVVPRMSKMNNIVK